MICLLSRSDFRMAMPAFATIFVPGESSSEARDLIGVTYHFEVPQICNCTLYQSLDLAFICHVGRKRFSNLTRGSYFFNHGLEAISLALNITYCDFEPIRG